MKTGRIAEGLLREQNNGRKSIVNRFRHIVDQFRQWQARWSRYRLPDQNHSEHKTGHSEHTSVLLDIVAPARTQKRLQPKDMEKIILQLCQQRWLTRNELAQLLGRHPDGLRQRFLNPMVGHGYLKLRFPDKPNRADQAYTATAS